MIVCYFVDLRNSVDLLILDHADPNSDDKLGTVESFVFFTHSMNNLHEPHLT